ncbi:MAG: M48 family metallopeptidase [Bradymonadaceae bacterium]|nr:M48 family metallopeptidase [Lujinxingiaceae bacterium]
MNFFESQAVARKNTTRLVALFVAAVAAIALTIYFVCLFAFFWWPHDGLGPSPPLFDAQLFIVTVGVTLCVITMGSLIKIAMLSKGGSVVAESVGGRLVEPTTTDPEERRLMNVVEEMALAAGMPMPLVYVLDREEGINAFAAGYTINDAAVGVTRGCLKILTRDELQGVIAHEFSHILNGDMRLNIRLIGVLYGILMIYMGGRIVLRVVSSSGRGSRNGGGAVLAIGALGLALLMVGWLGVVFGRLIKSAVSRQREYLADASAVQFTRNPLGLSGALQKIGGYVYGGSVEAAEAEQMSHMFFESSTSTTSFFGGLTATHPPLQDRIRRVDPSFRGEFGLIEAGAQLASSASAAPGHNLVQPMAAMAMAVAATAPSSTPSNFAPAPSKFAPAQAPQGAPQGAPQAAPQAAQQEYSFRPEQVVDQIGHATAAHLAYSSALLRGLPDEVRSAMHDPFGAVALMYTLVLDADLSARQGQGQILSELVDQAQLRETQRLWKFVAVLDPNARVPLIDLSIPALRKMAPDQYQHFARVMTRLIYADGKVTLFEFVIQKVLRHRLDASFGRADARMVNFHAFTPLRHDCNVLISALAHVGQEVRAEAVHAHGLAMQRLPGLSPGELGLLAPDQCGLDLLDVALDRLGLASPVIKQFVIDAAAHCVLGDGKVSREEAELLRAICDVLDCPLPPFLPDAGK